MWAREAVTHQPEFRGVSNIPALDCKQLLPMKRSQLPKNLNKALELRTIKKARDWREDLFHRKPSWFLQLNLSILWNQWSNRRPKKDKASSSQLLCRRRSREVLQPQRIEERHVQVLHQHLFKCKINIMVRGKERGTKDETYQKSKYNLQVSCWIV